MARKAKTVVADQGQIDPRKRWIISIYYEMMDLEHWEDPTADRRKVAIRYAKDFFEATTQASAIQRDGFTTPDTQGNLISIPSWRILQVIYRDQMAGQAQ